MRMHPAHEVSTITVSFSQGIRDLGEPYQKDFAATNKIFTNTKITVVSEFIKKRLPCLFSGDLFTNELFSFMHLNYFSLFK